MFFLFLILYCLSSVYSQDVLVENAINPEYTTSEVKKKRLQWTLGLGSSFYAGSSVFLYKTWYEDYPTSGFHTFNDLGAWQGVDKTGHVFSGYFQSHWAYQVWRWVGVDKKSAILAGSAVGFIAQTTIEIMDGFSEEWGFSFADFSSNLVGIGLFASQQAIWDEQRFLLKTSSSPFNYYNRYGAQGYQVRADELFGNNFATRYLKDYNAQTTWVSMNLKSFFPDMGLPEWLNIAIGYGGENMFGATSNKFIEQQFEDIYPRYSQFYLSLDADLSRIETTSSFLRTLLDILNILKIPFSTLEINTLGEIKFHILRF